jgi:L-amino acid N-acyltransferase YncA
MAFEEEYPVLAGVAPLVIRIALPEHLPRIVEIYNQAIPSKCSTADTSPLRTEDRETWLAEHNPEKYPIFVAELDDVIAGWCSLSAYRPGRMALRYTAEISCYIDHAFQRRGVGTALFTHAIAACPGLQIKNVFAILLDRNVASEGMMKKMGFQLWGCLPRVADFDGQECGHLYFGKRVWD